MVYCTSFARPTLNATGQAVGSSQPLHSKILTVAAREVLDPIDLVQIGRSRTWLADQEWWLCIVEFQPSSWSRGSYLNVGCNFLWQVKDYVSFDLGDRVADAGYSKFENEAQFTVVARKYAELAAVEVQKYRKLLSNVAA